MNTVVKLFFSSLFILLNTAAMTVDAAMYLIMDKKSVTNGRTKK